MEQLLLLTGALFFWGAMADTETLVYLVDLQMPGIEEKTGQLLNFKKTLEDVGPKSHAAGEGLHHTNESASDMSETMRGGREALAAWTEEFGKLGFAMPGLNTGFQGATAASRTFVTEGLNVAAFAAGVVAISGVTAELTALGAEWQSTFSNMAIQAGVPVQSVRELRSALEGLDVSFGTVEIAESLTLVIARVQQYTGETLSAAQATQLMTAATNLAEASGQSLSSTTQALVQQMIASRTGFEDVARVSDILFNATRLTGVSIEGLSTAMGRIQARMGSAAPDIGQVATVLDIMSASGLSGNRAMMLVYQALESLASPSADAEHALSTLGVEVERTATGQLDVIETIKNLKSALENIHDPAQRHAAEVDIMGRNYGLLEDLIRPSVAQIDAMHEKITESNTAFEGAEKHNDDLRERLEKLGKQATDTGGNLGTELAGGLIKFADTIEQVGPKIDTFLKDHLDPYLDKIGMASKSGAARVAGESALQGGAPGSPEWEAAMAGIGAPPALVATETAAAETPTTGTGTYESAEQKKKREEQEKIAAAYAAEQRMAQLEDQREQARAARRAQEQSRAYTEEYGAGADLGGKALEKIERETQLRQQQYEAAKALREIDNEHADAIESIRRGWEDSDRALKEVREDSDYLRSIDREDADRKQTLTRQDSDYGRQVDREDADYRRGLFRQDSDYQRETIRQDAEYAKSQDRAVADYAIQLTRQRMQEETNIKRQNRDTGINDARSLADIERGHADRIKEIREQGGANIAQNLEKENDAYNKQLDSLRRTQQFRAEDEKRHRADQEEDQLLAQYAHNADVSRAQARHAEDTKLTRAIHALDSDLSRQRHDTDLSQTRERHDTDLSLTRERATEDVGTGRERRGEDIASSRERAGTDVETARARQQQMLSEQRAFQEQMTAGAGGIRDQVERMYGIAPEQIALANEQRAKQEAYQKMIRDMASETADANERSAAANERAMAAHDRVLREYTAQGGNPTNLPAPFIPSPGGGRTPGGSGIEAPTAPGTPGSTPGEEGGMTIHNVFNFDGATFVGGEESARKIVDWIEPILLTDIRGKLPAGRGPA